MALLAASAAAACCHIAFVSVKPPARTRPREPAPAHHRISDAVAAGAEERRAEGPEVPFARYFAAALSALAALTIALAPLSEAQAARFGGRISGATSRRAMPRPPGGGFGGGFRASPPLFGRPAPTPRRAPAAPRPPVREAMRQRNIFINKNVYVAPPPVVMATPLVSPLGLMGGPAVIAPAPSLGEVVVGTVLGNAVSGALHSALPIPSGTDRVLQEQQRQDERLLDRQASEIETLKRELQDLKTSSPSRTSGPAPVLLQVTVPEGKACGQPMAVKAPDGPTFEVKVPEGMSPGQTFNVQLPASQR